MNSELKNDGQSSGYIANQQAGISSTVERTPAQKALILAHLTLMLASLDKEEVRQHGNT